LSLIHASFQWGQEGHKIIAQIAADRIGTTATSVVSAFIGSQTLAGIAPMPDDYDHTSEGRWSAPCHYVNMPSGATQFEWSDCPDCCVVKAIQNYTTILTKTQSMNPTPCDFARYVEPCALEFLVHFVGDVHQPLHVGWADDRGGNEIKVVFYGQQSNLHSVWDDLIIQRWNSDFTSAYKQLEAMITPAMVQKYGSDMNPIDWADESFDYVLSTVYNFTSTNGVGQLGADYYNRNLPIVMQRLIAAGIRLGNLLNTVLVG